MGSINITDLQIKRKAKMEKFAQKHTESVQCRCRSYSCFQVDRQRVNILNITQ